MAEELQGPSVERSNQDRSVEATERTRVVAHELSWALRAVNRASADADAELARRLELRPLDHAAMSHILTSTDPLGPTDLSARLGISTGSATELVDRLEQRGNITRAPHPNDRRRRHIQPTPAAIQQVLDALHPLMTAIDALSTDFTAAEQQTIQRYLRSAETLLLAYAHPKPSDPAPP